MTDGTTDQPTDDHVRSVGGYPSNKFALTNLHTSSLDTKNFDNYNVKNRMKNKLGLSLFACKYLSLYNSVYRNARINIWARSAF